MKTVRLTLAEALVRYLVAQKIAIGDQIEHLFGGSFAIFGHGNVTCLGQQLKNVEDQLPAWRGQNQQSMAMAAIAYARANRRRRIGIATTSIGPGALSEKLTSMAEFDAAFARAKAADRTYVIVVDIDPTQWSTCDCWCEVGLPDVTRDERTKNAIGDFGEGRKHQRRGV